LRACVEAAMGRDPGAEVSGPQDSAVSDPVEDTAPKEEARAENLTSAEPAPRAAAAAAGAGSSAVTTASSAHASQAESAKPEDENSGQQDAQEFTISSLPQWNGDEDSQSNWNK